MREGALSSTYETYERVGGFAIVGEGIQTRSEIALTHSTPTQVVPPVALSPVMSEVEHLGLRAARIVGE